MSFFWRITDAVALVIGYIALAIALFFFVSSLISALRRMVKRYRLAREQRKLIRTLVTLKLLGLDRGFSPAPHEPHARIADNGRAYLEEEEP